MAQFVPFLHDRSPHVRIHKRQVTDLGELSHYHDCYQILYVEKGKMLHQEVVLQPGDCFIVPPGYVHHTRAAGADLSYFSLTFRQELFSPGFVTSPAYEFLDKLRLARQDARLRIRLPREEAVKLEQLLRLLMEEYAEDHSPDSTMAGHLVAATLRILARCDKPADEPAPDPIAACIRYMDANYMLPLTPESLAKQFAVSRSSLMEQFPKKTGLTVKRYLHHRRIRQAKKLLATGSVSVRETAKLVGYEDLSTFYRNFKKLTGVPPSEYQTGKA
ncbi:MAG: AraC family transcriptional regulator [Oscillospiraceae bacterium]|nr:AraC family transcriptional regulator [Oscillospiraceae bacterium]